MTLDDKKAYIIKLLPLGVDLQTAYVQSRLTFDEMAILDADEAFQADVDFAYSFEEVRLLELYKDTVEKAANHPKKLDHKGLKDALSLLKPERYSTHGLAKRVGYIGEENPNVNFSPFVDTSTEDLRAGTGLSDKSSVLNEE